MSKDDLLFKNVLKVFGVVIALVVGLPLVYLVVPGLVTSLLMLGGIVGFFWAVIKFVSVASSCDQATSDPKEIYRRGASIRYGGNDYMTNGNSWNPPD